jgi:hypothetical protein
METKICTKCSTEKHIGDFYKKKSTKDGLRPECKVCTNEVNKKYVEKNAEKVAETHRKYREENRAHILEQQSKYRDENREIVRKRSRDWGRKNSGKVTAYQKQYYRLNKDWISEKKSIYDKANLPKKVIREQRRRSLRKQLPSTFANEQWITCLDYFNNSCCYCGSKDH